MQNVGQNDGSDSLEDVKTMDVRQARLTPPSGSPVIEKAQVLAALQQNFMDLSASDEEEASEVESFILEQDELEDGEPVLDTSQFLLSPENIEGTDLRNVDPETQARLEALLEAAGIGKLSTADGKAYADPEVLRRLTSSVSCALDEAAAALTRMRAEQQGQLAQGDRSLAEACSDGDIGTVRKLLDEGRSVHETTEEGESLLSLACSAGYYELAQVLLAMRANVEDRGIKGDCTPLMEAASGGYVDIVKLLILHDADVNAQSSAGNTPLHYAACGGYEDVVRVLIKGGANVEEHNENGHTPLMEAASAGKVNVAKILLEAGAGINTHSNEFKESALTLACYKGHLDMVKFLLEAGADQEHKTDEMHTALMEASMDGHVEVARLLLDSGAQVNMPADSFESPLTLAACGGHVELANLLIERGANLEEVNDEGYTPLMEAAREGHEEMVALLLAHGAEINAQTEETQETALTLACCGGFLEVADFLIKAGAHIELGCSTPLMEAAQEGHLDLVKYLLKQNANVHAQTGTGDTALTYACENGHTDVAEVLLEHGAELEHESEGGRTPLMKAARAGHLCTVKFLISKGADVNRQTTNNDHTVLSLACAGGHLAVVDLLLSHGGDPTHRLKDGSTMLIEGAKGGHTQVVTLLLDYPNSVLSPTPDLTQLASPETHVHMNELPRVPMQGLNNIVPPQDPDQVPVTSSNYLPNAQPVALPAPGQLNLKDLNIQRTQEEIRQNVQKSLSRSAPTVKQKENDTKQRPENKTPQAEADGGCNAEKNYTENSGNQLALDFDIKADMKTSEKCEKLEAFIKNMMRKADLLNTTREEQIVKKQQILEELQRVERELHEKAQAQMLLSAQQHASDGHQGQGDNNSNRTAEDKKDNNRNNNNPDAVENVNNIGEDVPVHPNGIEGEGEVANGLSVIDRLIDSIVIDLDVPFTAPAYQLGLDGTAEKGGPASSVDKHKVCLIAKQESSGSLDSTGAVSCTSSTNQTPATASEGGDGDACSIASLDVKEEPEQLDQQLNGCTSDQNTEDNEEEEEEEEGEEEEDDEEEEDGEEEEEDDEEDFEGVEEECPDNKLSSEEQASRASSEEVDLSNVVPAVETEQLGQQEHQPEAGPQPFQQEQQFEQQPQLDLPAQEELNIAAGMMLQPLCKDGQAAALALAGQMVTVQGLDQQTLQQLQTLPLHTVLEQSVAAATSTAAALDQQHQQLQQQRQQLQNQLALQQQLQAELQQQLKLQQEHQQLQQQLKQQQALTQQMELQQLTKHPKFQQLQFGNAGQGQTGENKEAVPGAVVPVNQKPAPTWQKLQAQVAKVLPAPTLQKFQAEAARILPHLSPQICVQQQGQLDQQQLQQQQQQQQQQDIQHQLKLQQVQHSLQQQLAQVSHQVQQLQASQQLTQQELLAQAQQLQQQLQQAQQLQQLMQQKHVTQQLTQQLTQQDLLQQAQQLQQQLQQAQQLQQLAQQQKQFTDYQGLQKKSKKKNTATCPQHSGQALPLTHTLNYGIAVTGLPGTSLDTITPPSSTPLTPNPSPASPQICPPIYPAIDLDAQTESNHDTALTFACAGGHVDLVSLLLSRGADIEHRDKKGFTPLILAATGGHSDVVEMLLDNGADIEAQSERTKDTPLSLACSGGRYEVVDLLLARGANKEHRNVSDYTPLSLAASGGYVNIIKLLLSHGAEINSRTGSKLGISPLMLAAMNGHTAAVKLLLDMGSDINAQIETNRNTALTLACFQGRQEVVSLLVDRKANIEHRAKTGLTPLMEAASGGYVEVGRVLLDKGADVNAPPVPSSRDTALTIAADKGHYRFVELLLSRSAAVDVKNKKGNSPLWLACNGGHLDVVQLLVNSGADIDSQDNRKVSCLMASFRKGHIKVVKWMVKHVTQFPSDQECMRYTTTITDKELLKKCHQCMEIIVSAKDRQAAEANRHASILLEQLDLEKSREESKRAAAARKREKRRRKKKEKQEQAQRDKEQVKEQEEQKQKDSGSLKSSKNSTPEPSSERKDEDDEDDDDEIEEDEKSMFTGPLTTSTTTITGMPFLSGSNKNLAHKRSRADASSSNSSSSSESNSRVKIKKSKKGERDFEKETNLQREHERAKDQPREPEKEERVPDPRVPSTPSSSNSSLINTRPSTSATNSRKKRSDANSSAVQRHGIGELDDFRLPGNVKASPKEKEKNRKNTDKSSKVSSLESFDVPLLSPAKGGGSGSKGPNITSPKRGQKKEDGWKEVIRKSGHGPGRSKKVTVPSNAISRVIGRGGSNINAIREVSGAHIDVDKQKGSGDRVINIKGSAEATRQAHMLITALIKDPDKELDHLLPKHRHRPATTSTSCPFSVSSTIASSANLLGTAVWQNSMANHVGAALLSSAPLAAGQQKVAKLTTQGGSRPVVTSTVISVHMQAPFANVVRQSPIGGQRSNQVTIPSSISTYLPPPSTAMSPKRMPTNASSSNTSTSSNISPLMPKSPNMVARQLFPTDSKTTLVTTAVKASITYSTVSLAKTKVVTATTPTFASKVDITNRPMTSKGQQKAPGSSTAAVKQSQSHNLAVGSVKSSEPQPLPIKTPSGQTITPNRAMQGGSAVSVAPGDYSPFNNRFSREVAENMLVKKDDQPDKMNFASVAAAGVVPSSSPILSSVSPGPPAIDAQLDPSLQSKAPGYKAPGQRTSSPLVGDHTDPRVKAPGYMPHSHQPMHPHTHSQHSRQPPHPSNSQASIEAQMKTLGFGGNPSFGRPSPNTVDGEADPSKAPGYKGTSMGYQELPESMMRAPSFRIQSHMLQSAMGPGPNMMGNAMGFSSLSQHHPRDEYSMPNKPMTLPKIESTLNPNAPDFTSRTSFDPSGRLQHMPGNMIPGFNNVGAIGGLAGISNMPPNMNPANIAGQPGFRVPPPGPQGVLSQQAFNTMLQGTTDFLPTDVANGHIFTRYVSAALMSTAAVNLPTGVAQFSPLAPTGSDASTTPPISSSKDGSPIPPVSSAASPSSSNAPSPTDQLTTVSDTPHLPRPIGTERAHKKPHNQAYPSMAEAGAAGLWAFNTDIGADWISSMSSVMTTSVVTSTVMTPGLSAEGEERPASHPAMSPQMLAATFPPPDSSMDPSIDSQYGQASVLMASNGGTAVFAPNGVPAGAAAALPMPHLYTQAAMGADMLPPIWNQQLKVQPEVNPQDAKMMWNWNPPNL